MIGAGAVLGSFQAKLGLDSTDYAKGMINAESVSRIFGQSFATFVSNPLLGSIQIFKNLGSAVITGSVQMLAYAESIERLSQQTGASEPLLIGLQKQLELAGFSAERARQSFLVFNKFIADYNNDGPLANQILSQMGINLNGLTGFDDIFRAMIERLSQIEDPAMKASIAMKLFGEEAGHDTINAIGGGNAAIDEMIDRYTRLGFIIDRGANSKLASLNTNIGLVSQAIDGVKTNAIREFLFGVTGDLDLTNEKVVKLADSINKELGPASRAAGEYTSNMALGLGEVLRAINPLIDELSKPLAVALNAADNDNVITLNGVRSRTPDMVHPERAASFQRNRDRGQEYLLDEVGL